MRNRAADGNLSPSSKLVVPNITSRNGLVIHGLYRQGMTKFQPPVHGSKTPEQISMKLGLRPHTHIYVALRQREWSRRTRDLSHVLVS